MQEDKQKNFKIVLIVISFGIGIWSFSRGESLLGFVGLFLGLIFVSMFFVKGKLAKEQQLSLTEMVNKSTAYLEDFFKISVGKGINRNFKLYNHGPSGEREYRLVFVYENEDAEKKYYPVTMDKFSGNFGEATGTIYFSVNEAEYFLNKEKGATIKKPVSIQDVEDLMENNLSDLRARLDVISQNRGGAEK